MAVLSGIVPFLVIVVVGIGVLGIAGLMDILNKILPWRVISILQFNPLLRL